MNVVNNSNEKIKSIVNAASDPARKRGLVASALGARSVTDAAYGPELEWLVKFSLPFSWVASKNATYGRGVDRGNRIFIKSGVRQYRDQITALTKQAMRGITLRHAKLWLDIFVEKPANKGDAVNVVDLVCDAIKHAIPLDDRWYSIRRLDWSINKADPHLFIGLGQETGATDSKACSYCGEISPLSDFTFSKSGNLGRANICIRCRKPSYPKGPNKKHRSGGYSTGSQS